MIEASELLRSYVHVLRHLSGADAVSLFVPAALTGSAPAMLIHEGDAAAVPELRDLDAAAEFAAEAAAARRAPGAESDVLRSAEPGGAIVPLPATRLPWAAAWEDTGVGQRGRRRTDPRLQDSGAPPAAWLGFRLSAPEPGAGSDLLPLSGLLRMRSAEESVAWWWTWLLALGGELAGHAVQVSLVLRDPVTGLPGRAAFQGVLTEELEKARLHARPVCLLLVNPDDFGAVNQRFGREIADDIIREMIARLRSALRATDLVAKYGGVIYAAVLLDTPAALAHEVATKVLEALAEANYQGGSIPLRLSVGVAAFEPGDEGVKQGLDLIRRADQALNAAKRAGGGRVVCWEEGWPREIGHLDPMTGIFTGDMAADYRNMVLLWDAVSVMAASDDFEAIAAQVVSRLFAAFKPDRVGLLARSDTGAALVSGLGRAPGEEAEPVWLQRLDLGAEQQAFVGRASRERRQSSTRVFPGEDARQSGAIYAYYVPLVAREEPLGGVYLDGPRALDSADLMFLEALATQLAVALDRARLAEQRRRRQDLEQQRLRAELGELRQALQRAKLEYRSPEMEELLSAARRVAPTDATVLVMGESGTGKELLARTIHELSPRRHRPLVVVDCSAIAPSLADSELFGHERGAYTGAQERRVGRLAQAENGTVLLDEIGELPLEVQSKLLRFVQEKQLTAVGGSRPRGLDVRIIAATNRDLRREVAEGRFRGDLFHRLDVVKLVVPPLRERRDDILHLAGHFLSTYATLYHKPVRRLAPEAETLLLRHAWPGNVRELQNRMMQAVILCEGDELGAAELSLAEPGLTQRIAATSERPSERREPASDPAASWERLRSCIGEQIERAIAGGVPRALPLGRWLVADLALEASVAAGGVARRACALLGVPETTYRRLVRRAADEAAAGIAMRPSGWEAVRAALAEVARQPNIGREDRIDLAERLALQEILPRVAREDRVGASLLGVSLPTYRRRTLRLRPAS